MSILVWLDCDTQLALPCWLIVEMYRHQWRCKHGCQTGSFPFLCMTGSFLNHMQTIFGPQPFTVLKWGNIAAGNAFIFCNLGDFCKSGSDHAIVYPLVC